MKEPRPKRAHSWQFWFPLPMLLVALVVVIYTTRTNEAEQSQVGSVAANGSLPNQATLLPTSSPTLTGPELDATKQAWLDNEQKRRNDARTRVAQGAQPSRTIAPPPTPRPQPTPGPGLATCMGGDKSFSLNSCWGGRLGDEYVYVAAGALRSDTSQGAIEVYTTTLQGKIGSPFMRYSSPQREGSLTIAYVDMPRVTLIAPQDTRLTAMFVFNLQSRQWESESAGTCQIYPIAFRADTFSDLRMRYDKKQVPLNTAGATQNTGAGDGSFAWLSFTRTGPVKNNQIALPVPGEGVSFINPDNAGDHRPSTGDWIQGRETITADLDAMNSVDFLETGGFIVPVALWDQARGQGANVQYHVSGFAWVYVAGHTSFPPTELSVAYWGPATCSDR